MGVTGIQAVTVVPGHYELIDNGQNFAVLVDNAHTPSALAKLLDSLRDCMPSRIILVFGCDGYEDKIERAYMGEISHYKADIVFVTNSSPRGEYPEDIIKDIVSGWPYDLLQKYHWFIYPWYQDIGRLPVWFTDQALWAQAEVHRYILEDRHLAIQNAIYAANEGDVVVIAGRGNSQYQEWVGRHVFDGDDADVEDPAILTKIVKGWFDDRAVCRDALIKLHQLQAIFPRSTQKTFPWTCSNSTRRHPLEELDDSP